jgi:hypothetical protein
MQSPEGHGSEKETQTRLNSKGYVPVRSKENWNRFFPSLPKSLMIKFDDWPEIAEKSGRDEWIG